MVLKRKHPVGFAKSLAVSPPSSSRTPASLPSGNLHSSLINYERIHLHVRSSAKKLDKIDPPQFILSIFPRNGLPPMFYSWRHQLSLLSPTPVTFSIYSIYSCKTPLGWAGGRPPRKVHCALGLTQSKLSQPGTSLKPWAPRLSWKPARTELCTQGPGLPAEVNGVLGVLCP